MAKVEIMKKEETLPATTTEAWGTENIEAKDVTIPRIQLAQKMSESVDQEKVKVGCFFKSTDLETVGTTEEPLEMIPLTRFKQWTVEKKTGEKWEYVRTEDYTASNASSPWEFTEEGIPMRRTETMNFYVLLTKETDGIPALISFRRTGYACGKALSTHLLMLGKMNQPAARFTVKLHSTKKTNDLGTFYVPTMEKGRETTSEELTKAKEWYDTIQKQKVTVDDTSAE